MPDGEGDGIAVVLLRALPAEVADQILGKMEPAAAERLRTRLRTAPAEATSGKAVDEALAQFFDLLRIAERPAPAPAEEPPLADSETPADPVDEIKAFPPDQLARALEGEQPGTVVLVLSSLEPAVAGQVMKRLPAETRADIAIRMTKLGARNPVLLREVMKAVAEKARRIGELPPQPTQDELITNLADMLRAMPRAERLPVLQKIGESDADLAAKVLEQLYRIDDLLRIPDRQLQVLLGKIDVKTLAVALKNVEPAIRDKISANMSTRSRTALSEESELLGTVPASRIREAQAKVMALVKKGEEDGEITLEE